MVILGNHAMPKLNLIPKYDVEAADKCKICMQTRTIRKPFTKYDETYFFATCINNVCDMHSTLLGERK